MHYQVRILADSIADNVRLVTMEVVFPRFILAEFNTHRVFSRNSASSRAIPVRDRIRQVWRSPFVPEAFSRNKSGMQADKALDGWQSKLARWTWIGLSWVALCAAWLLSKIGTHKQHANRVLELWSWHTVVVSSTEWENFFALRDHSAAQPEMQITARMMREAFEASTPRKLELGDWHLPYIEEADWADASKSDTGLVTRAKVHARLVRLSVVRCAAVSFDRQYSNRTMEQATKRHDEMVKMAHWSPFEHAAQVDACTEDFIGNFRAPWRQYRKTFDGESVFAG